MYGHSLKGTDSVKFLGVHIDNHLCMKRHVEHIERASFISTMIITRLNSIKATLLYTDYACRAITALNKTQRQKLEVLQIRCLRYARRALDSSRISNIELRSCCNFVSEEQCILALVDGWWKKASVKNDDIISFTYHNQSDNKEKTPLNIIKGNRFF